MTIKEQIQWVESQLRYSELLGDGDADKWRAVLKSLCLLNSEQEQRGSVATEAD